MRFEATDLNNALDSGSMAILNQLNNISNYVYFDYEVDASVGSTIKFKRNKTALSVNGSVNTTSGYVMVAFAGTVKLATRFSAVIAWDDGITLTAGKTYKASYQLIAGTVVNDTDPVSLPTISVYKLGTSNSIGTFERVSNTEAVRTFVAPDTVINICLYAINDTVFTNAIYNVTLEEVPEEQPHFTPYISPVSVGLYGDSICYGTIVSGTSYATVNFKDYIESEMGYNATNNAVGGTGFCKRSDTTNLYDAVLAGGTSFGAILLLAGTNDYGYNKAVGAITDTPSNTTDSTFYSAVKYVIEYIMQQNPDCQLMIVTPIFRNYHSSGGTGNAYTDIQNNAGCTLGDFCDALVSIGEHYNIPVLDSRKNSPVNLLNYADKLTETGSGTGKYLHPTDDTYPVLYKKIVKWMHTII